MSDERPVDEITRRLLACAESERDETENEQHPEAEQLALFCEGVLSGDEQATVARHLADCSLCRQVAASVMISLSESAGVPSTTVLPGRWLFKPAGRRMALATAALVLLAVSASLFLLSRPNAESIAYERARQSLLAGDFETTADIVRDVRDSQSVVTNRLLNLQAQAIRRMPSPVALQGAGSLQDFGYQIGGIVARDPASAWDPQRLAAAGDVLRQAGQDDLDVVLNAGHLRLSQGRPQEALALFESARTLAPDHALVWLGIGLASFLNDDHTGAERAFRQSLAIDPLNRDARMNLAMVLDEQGKIAESLEQWRQLLAYPLRDEDRRQVELHIRELELQLSPGRD